MKYTEKLNLKKPEEEDFISVSDYTDNMEIIDQAVTDASQKADDATFLPLQVRLQRHEMHRQPQKKRQEVHRVQSRQQTRRKK